MQEDTAIKDELIRRLLAAHEELMRENSKLREASASDKDEEILRLKNMLAEKDAIINTQDKELKAKNDVINKKDDLLEKRDVKIAKLTKQVEYLTRQMFGGKSERFINPNPDARQLDLFEGVDLLLGEEVMSGRQFFYWDKGSRAALVALKLFHGYQGAIQTDGHPLYEQLDGKKGIILLGCLAHARRKFEESLKNDEERASHALAEIQLVYDVERQIKDQNLSYKEAAELRARLAYPILVRFEKWMVAEHPKLLKGSPIEAAIQYTYKRFDKLTRYHLDGRYHIDNNACERGMRPVAQGRSAYLFCKNDDTAEGTAILYSFMECCRAAGVDFRKWMIYFLEHVHQYDDDYSKDLDELLPDNLKAAGVL